MASSTPANPTPTSSPSPDPTPTSPSLTIPITLEEPEIQLQLILMTLVHTYGLTMVLEALNDGMFKYFEGIREDNSEVLTPILEALGTAHTVSKYVWHKNS
ncbi:MAG: hypothetical protein AAGF93_00370 [Cyanobacteria bacterium P01_H01_bin.105]